jgi:hypothetical protein
MWICPSLDVDFPLSFAKTHVGRTFLSDAFDFRFQITR